MIARTATRLSRCDDDELRQLLEETLPESRVGTVQDHVSDCPRCQDRLAKLAGDEPWWNETISVLKDITKESSRPGTPQSVAPEMAVDWIRPILEPSSDGIGMLGEYPVHQIIGQGGMGVVLGGSDMQLGRPIAIKVLSPHLAGVGAARSRFMREAQAAAAIVHPSIVPIYRVVTSSRLPYLVMPLIEGGNLQQRIEAEGPLDIAEVLSIGRQIAEGLSAAHRLGVIHRDIKPANILVESGNGRVLISDFGLARALDDASLTVSGMIAGTPQYMSPEQARGEPIDVRSDLFSLGSLIYAMATGRPPFRADNPLAVLKKITESPPRAIETVNERMPPWLGRLVGQLMEIDRDQRIGNADEAAELLAAAHAHVQNPSLNRLPHSLTSEDRKIAWRPSLVALTIALVVGLTVGGASWFFRPADTPTATPVQRSVIDPIEGTSAEWIDQQMRSEMSRMQFELQKLESEFQTEFP